MDANDLKLLGKRMPTDDLISRQLAIYVVKGIDSNFVKYIEALPSAQPIRKKGKWITQEFGSWAECSECHELYDIPIANSNFCPNCGVDMRGNVE